jgi:hypothetical protein
VTQTAQSMIGLGAKAYIQSTQGTAITVSSGTVSGGTLIGGTMKITPPKLKWGTWDKTELATPNTGRLKGKTLIDNGEVKIEGFYKAADAGQVLLETAFNAQPNSAAGDAFGFLIELPINALGGQTTNGDLVFFNAIVTEFEIGELETDKDIPFSATLTVTGPVTVTEGS